MKFEKGTWLEWIPATKKPDSDITMLVYSPKAAEPVWLGYWDGEVWRDVDGTPYATHVEAYAEVPYPVERKAVTPACGEAVGA